MRIKNSLANSAYSVVNLLLLTIFKIVYRTVFIKTLGEEYLGVNAAMTNIIAVLSLAELGFSQAIAYLLYNPLSNKNNGKTLAYINYFKKIYLYIGLFVIFTGIILLPFLNKIIPANINSTELNVIFILFIANSSISYFWSYKRTLIIADQKNYKIIPTITLYQALDLVVKSIVLFLTKDFIFILLLQLIIKLMENYFVNKKINKIYKIIFSENENILTKKEIKIIKEKTIATFYHKIGDVFVNNTENIVISAFVGVAILGVYSNYTMLIALLASFVSVGFNSIISSFGNLIIEKKEKSEENFYIIQLISIYIFGLIALNIYTQINSIIYIWIGENYILSNNIVLLLTINFFIVGIRMPILIAKSAGGVFEKDKYAPLCEGIISLIIALLLVHKYGIAGVLIGKLIAVVLVPLWIQPYITYKYIFSSNIFNYIINICKILSLFIISLLLSIFVLYYIDIYMISTTPTTLITKIIIVSIIYSLSFIILNIKNLAFIALTKKIKNLLKM
ncbi:hypothetical protein [Proteus terrae]|uniref:hypothetical protein n=1 Tax=Proteus terrae TaxID=1574161 RepID=UPI001BAD1C5C|nr:hypothetical protein [Proteus terrae]QUT02204.1 hypothetical protein KF949_01905 [Proteus terrae subsp. cibarius]